MADDSPVMLSLEGLQTLIDVFAEDGYEVLGPRVLDGVITSGPVRTVDQLPVGWADDQSAGQYRLHQIGGTARFGYAVGPQSWKPLLHRPRVKTMTITQTGSAEPFTVAPTDHARPKRVFLGVRPCEMAAITVQDRVMLEGIAPDPSYAAQRENLFIVAVNCTTPAATCFCSSMDTGPAVRDGEGAHDLSLTELSASSPEHSPRYLARPNTPQAAAYLSEVAARTATARVGDDEVEEEKAAFSAAVTSMERELNIAGLPQAMRTSHDHPHWDDIAERCLSCGNCTAVCPTCFCTSVDDVTDLSGDNTDRWQTWDSCFSEEFSRLGDSIVRDSTSSRYRQWLVHKLGTWHDQFDSSGCVGCGRCIAWCPVGIDLTAEVPIITTPTDAESAR